jgi:PAS domain S-box-containing protein
MSAHGDEDERLRDVALENARAIHEVRRRENDELRAQREWFRVTLASIGDAVVTADNEGRVTFINGAAERLTGWTAAEAMGRPVGEVYRVVNEIDGEPLPSPIESVLRDGVAVAMTSHSALRTRGGTLCAIEDSATPIRGADGRMLGAVLVCHDVTERRRADEALREREERWRATFNQAAVGIAIATLEGRFLETNHKFAEILGYSPVELRARTVADITYVEDLPLTRRHLERLVAGEIPDYSIEKRYVRRDGSLVWSHTTVTLLRDARGRPQRCIGVIQDITARRRAEAAEREGERRLRLAMAVGSLGDWSWDKATDVARFSPRAAAIFGIDPERPTTWSRVAELIHPDDRAGVQREREAALAVGREYTLEYRVCRPDRDVAWVVSHGVGTYAADGTLTGLVGVLQDVTRRKHAEEALKDETRIVEIVNQTGMTLATKLDLGALVQAVTDAATELSGARFGAFFYNDVDKRGASYRLYALSGAPPEAFARFEQPRATPLFGPTFRGERTIRCDDVTQDPRYGRVGPHYGMPEGHLPVRSYLAVPVVSRAGEVIGGLFFGHPEPGVFTERSERIILGVAAQASVAIDNARLYEDLKRAAAERERLLVAERSARAEAERASLMKDEFLATLSHELRTPLNAILGWAQILLSGRAGADAIAHAAETIARNARAQAQLIEDLLEMNRIVSGKLRLDVQVTDLGSVIDAALDSVRLSAEAKGIVLEREVAADVAPVSGDPNRLQQVVWNLLSNALKFTPPGGRVLVRVGRTAEHAEIAVVDSGVGIAPDFMPHVFERFRQADSSTTRKHGGLGLGLAIVKQLTELHGGTVRAESDGEGQGATFVVRLPLAPAGAQDRRAPAADAPRFDGGAFRLERLRVLVVDDEPDARELVAQLLVDCGAQPLLADSAAQAWALVSAERPDVIVSDIGMPGRDGYQLIRAVRALPVEQGGATPAIALTAFARSEDRTRDDRGLPGAHRQADRAAGAARDDREPVRSSAAAGLNGPADASGRVRDLGYTGAAGPGRAGASSTAITRLRPSCFARYSAPSTARYSASASACAWRSNAPTPTLTVTGTARPSTRSGYASSSRRNASARKRATSSDTPRSTTANSSPPRRAASASAPPNCVRRRSPSATRQSSPTAWPRSSLTALKWSRSRISSASGTSRWRASTSAALMRSLNSRRFARPVRPSLRLRRSNRSRCARSSCSRSIARWYS